MVIKRKKLIFSIYCILVLLAYILSVNIVSPFFQLISKSLWILSLLTLSILVLIESKYKVNKCFIVPFLLLLLYSIMSSYSYLLHFNTSVLSMNLIASNLFYFLLFYTIVTMGEVFTAKEFFKPFLLGSLIVVSLSVLIYLGFEPTFYLQDQEALDTYLTLKFGDVIVGFSGVYLNQNTFGITLIITIATIFATIVTDSYRKKSIRGIMFFVLITAFAFLMLTVSRASILAVVLLISLYFIKNYKKKSSFYMVCIIVLALVMLYFYFNEQVDYLVNRVESDGTSGRTEVWSDALRNFYENPWFGVGNYRHVLANGVELSAHNVYIQKLASQGVLSTIFWYSWLVYGFYLSLKIYFQTKDKMNVLLSSFFISILVHQVFESTISNSFSILTLFLMVVYALIVNAKNKQDTTNFIT